jgi:hypothetical protein
LGVSCSGSAFAAPVVSVPMSLVLRGTKKLRVITVFVGNLTAADFGTYIVSRRTHRKHRFCCQECVFNGPLPSKGCMRTT